MTEAQKKTLGLAIASLICGIFSLIPLIGLLPSLPAIILGIIALIKINNNNETLKGRGLAISGIIMGSLAIVILPIIGLLAAIAIPNLLRAKISANEAMAQRTLSYLAKSAENYKSENNGKLPQTTHDLKNINPDYQPPSQYCGQSVLGYEYSCEFNANGYTFIAEPTVKQSTGTKIFTIKNGESLVAKDIHDKAE